jgi:hypothetical protein
MTIVLRPGESVENLVATGNGSCPRCGGALRRWGQARWRVVRGSDGESGFRPGRVRCADCRVTQVVLPPEVLVRRRDAMAVVGLAWRSFAGGAGARRVARLLGVPMETVRGWLRRLRALARVMSARMRGSDRQYLEWALASVVAEAIGAGCHSEGDLWRFVAYRSQGRLLCNTNWP